MSNIANIATTSQPPLTILHTSDWHLGRRLYGQQRYAEFEAFLAWLADTITCYKVDVLIVAGDIFDTMTPSNKAQALYYEFLGKISQLNCQHVVIVAGNHDSPTFLDAPRHILKFLNVHVIGTACDIPNDEVLTLTDTDGSPLCIITAVPYLRDRDVRGSVAGESADDKDANVVAGIRQHYQQVADIAKSIQSELIANHQRHIPIIATGHLFTVGGKTTEDDGVRNLYVGTLGKVSATMFDDCFDYVALGHLHVPQKVGDCEHIRYSGSPIAMGFGEARQQKQVLLLRFGADLASTLLTSTSTPIQPTPKQSAHPVTPSHSLSSFPSTSSSSSKTSLSAQTFMDDLFGFDEQGADNIKSSDINSSDLKSNSSDLKINSSQGCDTKGYDVNEEENEINANTDSQLNDDAHILLHHDPRHAMYLYRLPVPCFQPLAQISGDIEHIAQRIDEHIRTLAHSASSQDDGIPTKLWLEVIYTGNDIVSDLREQVEAMVADHPIEVLKIKNTQTYNKVLTPQNSDETLQDLNTTEVFERCLETHDVPDEQKSELRTAYEQILYDFYHHDTQAE